MGSGSPHGLPGGGHVANFCALLWRDAETARAHRVALWDLLDQGRIEEMTRRMSELLPSDSSRPEASREVAYFRTNIERMRYDRFRAQGLFVGFGVIESGCKTVLGSRLKLSGMEWSLRGANAIIALQCALRSGRFDDFWESRYPLS